MEGQKIKIANEEYTLLPSDSVMPGKARVGCQGVAGAYSQQAASKMFPQASPLFFRTFEGVIEAVKGGMIDFGILPLENNSYGSVRGVYAALKDSGLNVVRAERLLIRHELLVKPGVSFEEITSIRSHEQALGQCGRFVHEMEKKVPVIPVLNTAVAARFVAESDERGAAAIASPQAAEKYGLSCVRERVSDTDNNYTRFAAVTRDKAIYPGANRMSMILTAAHRPGSLAGILDIFAKAGINLLKLESCPIPGRDFEFLFYTDIASSAADPKAREAIDAVTRLCASFTFLGNYIEG